MKTLILIILFFSSVCITVYSQDKISGRLINCDKGWGVANEQIQLIHHDSIIQATETDKTGSFEFDNLNLGDYSIRYESKYLVNISIDLSLKNRNIKNIQLCYDSLDLSRINNSLSLDSISIYDSIEIKYLSAGCFHLVEEKLVITQIDSLSYHCTAFKGDSLINTGKKDNIDLILDEFLKMGTLTTMIGPHGCTTLDTYVVLFNGALYKSDLISYKLIKSDAISEEAHPISFLDGTCHWRGYAWLRKRIFE